MLWPLFFSFLFFFAIISKSKVQSPKCLVWESTGKLFSWGQKYLASSKNALASRTRSQCQFSHMQQDIWGIVSLHVLERLLYLWYCYSHISNVKGNFVYKLYRYPIFQSKQVSILLKYNSPVQSCSNVALRSLELSGKNFDLLNKVVVFSNDLSSWARRILGGMLYSRSCWDLDVNIDTSLKSLWSVWSYGQGRG